MFELESKVLEYPSIIGKHPSLETLGKILWARLDIATQEKAEDTAGLDFMDYHKMGVHIREMQEKVLGRQGVRSTPASSNRMVDGLQAPDRFLNADNSAGQDNRFLNVDNSADQHSAGQHSAGSDPWNQGEDPWQMVGRGGAIVPSNDLDAFGKGKGKSKGGGKDGKSKAPLDCWCCHGIGHPSYLCASPPVSGDSKSGMQCHICKGSGTQRRRALALEEVIIM